MGMKQRNDRMSVVVIDADPSVTLDRLITALNAAPPGTRFVFRSESQIRKPARPRKHRSLL